jgi:hypothetical protein
MFGSLPHIATPQHSITTAQYVVFSAKVVVVILHATVWRGSRWSATKRLLYFRVASVFVVIIFNRIISLIIFNYFFIVLFCFDLFI